MSSIESDDFTRTNSGTFAEAAIRDVNFILHIEGKHEDDNIENIRDYIFYKNLTSSLGFSVDIKIEGNCNSLMNESLRIRESNSSGHIFIFDRDHNEILGIERINSYFDFYTQGYSWENDFWTSSLLRSVVDTFCSDQVAITNFLKNFKDIEGVAKKYHLLNTLSRVNGKKIFDFGGSCNMPIVTHEGKCIFVQSCLDRLNRIWESFNLESIDKTIEANTFLINDFYNHPGYLIQGHSYEHLVLDFIVKHSPNLKIVSKTSFSDKDMLRSIATRIFIRSPLEHLNDKTIIHYRTIFNSAA